MLKSATYHADAKSPERKQPFFQPKRSVNTPGDIYEQEADEVAEKIVQQKPISDQPAFFTALPPIKNKVQREEKKEEKEGVEFVPFPTGMKGRWPGFGMNLDITHTQFDFGNPDFNQLSLGLNYPGEGYFAIQSPETAFKFGYDFAKNNLYTGFRFGGTSIGAQVGTDPLGPTPTFGLHLGYGHAPLFNYNMRSALQFGNAPLPYADNYSREVGNTDDAFSNWEAGGTNTFDRFTTLIGGVANFGSMTGDMYDVGSAPKYNWGAGVNFGYDPTLQWYVMAGVNFYLGKTEQKKEPVQRKCACEEEEEHVQRKELPDYNDTSETFDNYVDGLSNTGSKLPVETQSFFERRMGYDFSGVRVHTDGVAAKSAQSVNALAYTTGNHIVFNKNQFRPESESGKKLLAHELTHVVQQSPMGMGHSIQRKRELDITDEEEKKIYANCLKKIGETITKLEESSKLEGMPADIKETVELLRQKFTENKIKCYYLDGIDAGHTNFSTGEIYIDAKGLKGSPGEFANIGEGSVLHEGTHALHNKKFPKATGRYGKLLDEQREGKEIKATEKEQQDLIRLKTWTEYWAYRKVREYNNIKYGEKKSADDIHNDTVADDRVKKELRKVWSFDKDFDPRIWKPAG